jgi:hypothetical protein
LQIEGKVERVLFDIINSNKGNQSSGIMPHRRCRDRPVANPKMEEEMRQL